MKKRFFAVLLALILVMQTLPALAAESADVSLTPMGEITGFSSVRTIESTPYLLYEGSSGYGLMTPEGEIVTEDIYSRSMYAKYSYIEASRYADDVNAHGLLAWDGSEAMAFQYGDTKTLNNYWGIGFVLEECKADNYDYKGWNGDKYYMISRVDIWWLPTSTCVAELTRDQYLEAAAGGRTIKIKDRAENVRAYDSSFEVLGEGLRNTYSTDYDDEDVATFRDNGQQGLADRDGNVLIPAMFKSLYLSKGDYYCVSTGDLYGLVKISTAEVVVPAEYEKIEYSYYGPYIPEENTDGTYVAGKYVMVVKNGKLGYVDLEGNVTCEPKYSATVIQEKYGAVLSYSDLEGAVHFLAGDGVDTTLPAYERINALEGGSGFVFTVRDGNYNQGMIDWHGNELLPLEYDKITMTGDGKYVLANKTVDRVDHYELYQVNYPVEEMNEQQGGSEESAVEPETSQAEGEESSSSGSGFFSGLFGHNTSKEESSEAEESSTVEESSVPEESSVTESAGIDKASVSALVNSMITLLKTDAAGNQVTVSTLLDTAMASCASDDTLTTLLNTAKTLLTVDANSALPILESVVTLLK